MRRVDPTKFEEKRQEILTATDACYRRKGIAGTSIADICKAAGISPGVLYHYFKSRDEILVASFAGWVNEGAKEFAGLMKNSNPLGALTAVIEQAKDRNLRVEYLVLLEFAAEAGRSKKAGKVLQDSTRRMRGVITDFVQQGQRSGFVDRNINPDAAAAILFALFDGIRMMTVRDPEIELAEVLDQLQVMLGRYLAPSG